MNRLFLSIIFLSSSLLYGQTNDIIYLWPGKVPGEEKAKQESVKLPIGDDKTLRVSEVTNPSMEVWLPEMGLNTGYGVVVCPGGGYSRLSYNKEGTEIAAWLNRLGIAAFVLEYRVPQKRDGALQDAQRALRLIRANAKNWNLDVDKIGIMGFSAGGSLSARAATNYNNTLYEKVDESDNLSCRPSFALLIYPAYLDAGENKTLSPELPLQKDTPPTFIFQTSDDSYANSALVFAQALRNNKLPVELHIMPTGGHGYGLRKGNRAAESWTVFAENWFQNTLFPALD